MIELEQQRNLEATRWSRLALASAGLALSLAAIGWSAALGKGANAPFLVQNTLLELDRLALLGGIAGGVLTAGLLVGVSLIWKRWAALEQIERAFIAVAPIGVLSLTPMLLVPSVWFRNPLPFLSLLAALVLLLERALRAWLRQFGPGFAELRGLPHFKLPARLRHVLPVTVVVLAASAFSAFVFHYSRQQHQRLNTAAYDLGIYDNLMFTAISGDPFRSTVLLGPDGPSYLVGHAEFAMLLFTPLYWLWPKAETLLALQAVAIGFAAVPLYLFARTQLPRGSAVLLALAYLLYAPLHGSCFYDFHWLPITLIFQFTLYLAITRRRTWLFVACYVVLTLLREDVSVGLTMLGLFLLVSGNRPRLGLTMMLCSAVSFVAIRFGVMLWAGSFVFPNLLYGQLVAPGEQGFGSVIRTLMTNPAYVVSTLLDPKKLNYFLHLMAPLVFLPLRRPLLILLISGGTLFTFLTTAYEPTVSINFQYPVHWIPYLFAAIVLMLGVLSKQLDGTIRRRAALGALVFGVTSHSYVFGAVLQHETFVGGFLPVPYKITQREKDTYAALRRIVAKIPPTASVAATDMEVPHVSNRYTVFTLRSHHGDADYILVNRNSFTSDIRSIFKEALSRNDYGLVATEAPFYLFKRDVVDPAPGTDQALSALGVRARDRKPKHEPKHEKEGQP
jgi:uncharacterized membrane protein